MTTKQATRRGAFEKAAKVGQRHPALPDAAARKELRLFRSTFGETDGTRLFGEGADFDAECKKRRLRVGAFGKAVDVR